VRRYGLDSFGDPDYVSLYGRPPADWYARGVRLLGRTAVECTRDVLAAAIGREVAGVASTCPSGGGILALDPFAGSCNTLHWVLRHLPGARGVGIELDPVVFDLTARNLATLGLPVELLHADHQSGLAKAAPGAGELVVAFIAPPWGEALSETAGLDLRRTVPPVAGVVDLVVGRFRANPLLCAVQVFERTDGGSLEEVRHRFDWSTVRIYAVDAPGRNHGIVLGTRGWVPDEA